VCFLASRDERAYIALVHSTRKAVEKNGLRCHKFVCITRNAAIWGRNAIDLFWVEEESHCVSREEVYVKSVGASFLFPFFCVFVMGLE